MASTPTTAYTHSFASRLTQPLFAPSSVFFRDWETISPWMSLMQDIKTHYACRSESHQIATRSQLDLYLRNLGSCEPTNSKNPIDYTPLHQWHLSQVNELLVRSFWTGIDGMYFVIKTPIEPHFAPKVSGNLDSGPEASSVVATFGHLVVGAAFITPPPHQAYITYIVVRAGWEHSNIALYVVNLVVAAQLPTHLAIG